MTFTATLPRHKMASTLGGMRRLLKRKGTVPNYIRQAVETGIYRSNEELAAVWKERKESADDLATVMKRFRQDIVRGSNVQDYPVEYLILRQHPPIPDPPRVPKRIIKKMQLAPNPTERLVEKYLSRQEKRQRDHEASSNADGGPRSTQEYYRRLLGVSAPPPTSSLGQKPAAVQRAYAAAVKQYQLQRTQEGLSEQDAMLQVEELLKQHETKERTESRQRAKTMQEFRSEQPQANVSNIVIRPRASTNKSADKDTAAGSDQDHGTNTLQDTLQSIFKADRRTLEGMLRWSERLQAVPYIEWTVGASTALDHWIACRLLGMSEETWTALLEGEDSSLLSRGRDVVAVRETLFPETVLNVPAEGAGDMVDDDDDHELAATKDPQEKSIEELLASLGGLRNTPSESSEKPLGWVEGDDSNDDDLDAKVETLVSELQDWRRMNVETPYAEWPDSEKDRFNSWIKNYIDIVSSEAEKGQVDLKGTREALLSQPPTSPEESAAFWDALGDEEDATALLADLIDDGPPAGVGVLHSAFWELPYDEQLERLLNLGAIRPLMDEYSKESDRRRFLQRYGDTLLKGVVMEHLVPDPDGPVQSSDVSDEFALPKDTRFRLEMKAYQSADDLSSEERTRAMFIAWNTHKSGRARYEEKLFRTGRLGMRYGDRVPKDDELPPSKDDE